MSVFNQVIENVDSSIGLYVEELADFYYLTTDEEGIVESVVFFDTVSPMDDIDEQWSRAFELVVDDNDISDLLGDIDAEEDYVDRIVQVDERQETVDEDCRFGSFVNIENRLADFAAIKHGENTTVLRLTDLSDSEKIKLVSDTINSLEE